MTNMMQTTKMENTCFGHCMQNRELTWLKFNEHVLEEANAPDNPPLERLKFVAIFVSNLAEFYMVRVGRLIDYTHFAPGYYDNKTGMSASAQLDTIYHQTKLLNQRKDQCFYSVMETLHAHGVQQLVISQLRSSECKGIEKRFLRKIMPLLSPQIIDNRHPFPHIGNKQLHIAVNGTKIL